MGIYDAKGALVREWAPEGLASGEHVIGWNRRDDAGQRVASGIYFVVARAGSAAAARKIPVMR